MTNESSGSKRPWEGTNGTDSYKRPRAEDPWAKDWRDVHLKVSAPGRRSSADRRRDDRGTRGRDYDHRRRPSDHGHERERRDDRERDRKHTRDRDREYDRYRDRGRDSTSRRVDSKRTETAARCVSIEPVDRRIEMNDLYKTLNATSASSNVSSEGDWRSELILRSRALILES